MLYGFPSVCVFLCNNISFLCFTIINETFYVINTRILLILQLAYTSCRLFWFLTISLHSSLLLVIHLHSHTPNSNRIALYLVTEIYINPLPSNGFGISWVSSILRSFISFVLLKEPPFPLYFLSPLINILNLSPFT